MRCISGFTIGFWITLAIIHYAMWFHGVPYEDIRGVNCLQWAVIFYLIFSPHTRKES